MVKRSLTGLSVDELFRIIAPEGFKNSSAVAISHSIYKKGISDIVLFKNVPKSLKAILGEHFISGIFPPVTSELSNDGSVKYLFRTAMGKMFESVCIPDGKRNTICVSAQSGCRMGCSFCLTGRYGFHGNLTSGEIVNQVISHPGAGRITHVVFMGMGEPMDNLDNVLKACEILTSEWGVAISPRNVTVSTVGITPGIINFLKSSECNLTVSLFSPFPEERGKLVPAEKKYPVMDILAILKDYPLSKRRRLSLAYVMMKDLNDTDRHLSGLISIVKGSKIRINLVPYHRTKNDLNVPSSAERMIWFKHNLVMSGISASIRRSRGEDISAACGLLASGITGRRGGF